MSDTLPNGHPAPRPGPPAGARPVATAAARLEGVHDLPMEQQIERYDSLLQDLTATLNES